MTFNKMRTYVSKYCNLMTNDYVINYFLSTCQFKQIIKFSIIMHNTKTILFKITSQNNFASSSLNFSSN